MRKNDEDGISQFQLLKLHKKYFYVSEVLQATNDNFLLEFQLFIYY